MTLNHERFAQRGLRGIDCQTYADFEVIVTDDASSDRTPDIIDRWLANSKRSDSLVRHVVRHGICATLNEALSRASGELVAMVSLDDVWRPDRLACHVEAFDQLGPRVAVVYSDCETLDGAGQVTAPSYLAKYTPYAPDDGVIPPSGDIFTPMVQGNFIASPGVTSRRAAIDAVGGYDEDLPFEDWSMWLRLASRFDFWFDNHIVAQYRIHEDSYWRKLERLREARAYQIECLLRAHGLRPRADAAVIDRIRSLVQQMEIHNDPTAGPYRLALSKFEPPEVLTIQEPLDDAVKAVSALIADGRSVAQVTEGAVTVVHEPARILYLAPWMTVGGADKGTLDWFRYISPRSFRRYLLTTLGGDNAWFDLCDGLAEESWCLPELMSRHSMPQFVVDFIATRDIDLIHIMNSKLGFDLMPAIKLAFPDIPIVVQLHCEERGGTGYPRYVASRYDSLVDRYSVVSRDLKKCMMEYDVSPSKIEVIYLGVDANGEFNPERSDVRPVQLDSDGFHVLFPARLTMQKRPDLMLDIAQQARTRIPGVRFHSVGDGDLRGQLERRSDSLGLGDVVQFHGASLEMWRWYAACDATLLCSEFEGIPLVAFESMSMGVPIVAPLVGGTSELLDDTTGIGVAEDAAASDYADALAELANDAVRCAMIGKAARQRVLEGYKVEDMATHHQNLYRRLVARSKIRA